MKKFSKILICLMALTMVISSMSVVSYAADVNSVGSVEGDLDIANGVAVDPTTGKDTTQSQITEYHPVIEVDENAQDITCDVYATQAAGEDVYNDQTGEFEDGSVQALLPKTVILGGTSEEITVDGETLQANVGKYVVAVKGNINGTSYIKVQPSATFNMQQTGKADVPSKISQKLQHFYVADSSLDAAVAEETAGTGMISVSTSFEDSTTVGTVYTTTPLTAGRWKSDVVNFAIALVDTEI